MTTAAIRNKLHDYIQVADDKKIKAIYTMLEGEIEDEISWWKNNDFIQELNKEHQEWKDGKAKGYTLEEASASIELLKGRRK